MNFAALVILLAILIPSLLFLDTVRLGNRGSYAAAAAIASGEKHGTWAAVSSHLGLSMKYPHQEIGALWGNEGQLQVAFFFPASIVTTDASSTERLSRDIQDLAITRGLLVSVFTATSTSVDLKAYALGYLKKADQNNKKERIIKESGTATTFKKLPAYTVTRNIEGPKAQGLPQYVRTETFVRGDDVVYRISSVSSLRDTSFSRSGTLGKKYLNRVQEISQEVLRTIVFDGPAALAITAPRSQAPSVAGAAKTRRAALLSALRVAPFYDTYNPYSLSSDACKDGEAEDVSAGRLAPSPGVYIAANKEHVELHAYDVRGNHTGWIPPIPSLEQWLLPEENIAAVSTMAYADTHVLVITEYVDAKIEVLGKIYGGTELTVRGDGNGCDMASIWLPLTPHSIATIPVTAAGDIGPISYDIDGDKVRDFEFSLLYHPLPQKLEQLSAVMEDMRTFESKK